MGKKAKISNLGNLLDDIEQELQTYLFIEKEAAVLLTLWIMGSQCIESFTIFPRLIVTASEYGAGKSTLMSLVNALLPNGELRGGGTTAASLRRYGVETVGLLDECDSNKELSKMEAYLNGGYKFDAVDDVADLENQQENIKYLIYRALILAGVGDQWVHEALRQRSHFIRLEKATGANIPEVELDAFNIEKLKSKYQARIREMAVVLQGQLKPVLKKSIKNEDSRVRDNWVALFSIAKAAGTNWHNECNEIFRHFTSKPIPLNYEEQVLEACSKAVSLVNKIHPVLYKHKSQGLQIQPSELLRILTKDDYFDGQFPELKIRTLGLILGDFGLSAKPIKVTSDGFKSTIRAYSITKIMDATNEANL